MRIAVIGAGASGMMAAISAADRGADVTLFELNEKSGRKLLLTGSGKCNLTHTGIDGSEYNGSVGKRSSELFKRFGTQETISFFRDAGLIMYDRDGYIYPYSFQSFSVKDILVRKMKNCGIKLQTGMRVTGVEKDGGAFKVMFSETDKDRKSDSLCKPAGTAYDSVIIACGGMAAPKTGSDGNGLDIAKSFGHCIIPVYPALCGLECSDKDLKKAAKIRQRGTAALIIDGETISSDTGEIQFTDYGLSGIPVFNISRYVSDALNKGHRDIICSIDTVPMMNMDELLSFLNKKAKNISSIDVRALLEGTVCASIADIIIDRASATGENEITGIARIMKALTYHVTGTRPFTDAQTSTGGIGYDEITENLESKFCPGIYFTGEMLDIDGPCGGYNLQWAWSSGYVAGKGAANV